MDAPSGDVISKIAAYLAAAVVAVFGWFGRRQVQRIDDLEKRAVNRTEYNGTIKSLRDEIKQGNESTHRRLDDLYQILLKK